MAQDSFAFHDSSARINAAPVITLVEASQLVSRQLSLAPELEAVRQLAARITDAANQNPTLRAAGHEGLKALIWAITPEDPARMNPAKQAEAMLARANITSGDAVVWGKVLESFRAVSSGNVSREEGERQRSEAAAVVLDIGKISETNFAATEFRAKGLDYGTFDKLRSQGFNAQQIISAASLTKELKIDIKTDVEAVARLQRDVPGVETSLRGSRDNWQAAGKAADEAKKARARGDNARADELDKTAHETRERAERHDREEREHVERIRPDRLPDLQSVQGHIKAAGLHLNAAMPDAKPGEAREVRRAFDAAQRNPDDAAAQRHYQDAKVKFGDKPGSSRRFAEAEAEWKKQAAAKASHGRQRDGKKADTAQVQNDTSVQQAANNAKSNSNDDVIAMLGDDTADVKQKSAAAPAPSRPTQTAVNTKVAKPNQPQA